MDKDIYFTAHITWDEEERQALLQQVAELNAQLEKTSALTDTLVRMIEKIEINSHVAAKEE